MNSVGQPEQTGVRYRRKAFQEKETACAKGWRHKTVFLIEVIGSA